MSTGFLEVRKTRNFWISYFLNSECLSVAGGLGEVEVFPAAQVHFQRRRLRPRNFEFHIELSFPLVSTATFSGLWDLCLTNSPRLVMDTRYLRQKESKKSKYLILTHTRKMGCLLGLHEKKSLKRRNSSHYIGLLRRPGLSNYLHWPHGTIQAKTQCFTFITLIATVQGFKADKAVGLANCWASHGPTQLLRNRWAT